MSDNEYDQNDNLLELPAGMLRTAKYLRQIHNDYEAIDKEYKAQRLALEKAFYEKKQQHYDLRNKIISGETPVPEDFQVDDKPKAGEEEMVGIPSFWLTCLTSSSLVSQIITSEDMEPLEALTNISCEYAEDFTAFTLHFTFAENDYFENKVLSKKYYVTPDLLDEKNPALDKTESTVINWKTGKNLCVQVIEKKQKAKSGKNKGQIRTVTEEVYNPSFFHFFDKFDEEAEQEDEEGNENEAKLSIEEDYDIGHAIRTSIIPEATLWFTGENEDAYDYGDMDEEDEEEDGDEDDDEDDVKVSGGGFSAPASGAPGAPAPECNNN